jgi:hypothetical protein
MVPDDEAEGFFATARHRSQFANRHNGAARRGRHLYGWFVAAGFKVLGIPCGGGGIGGAACNWESGRFTSFPCAWGSDDGATKPKRWKEMLKSCCVLFRRWAARWYHGIGVARAADGRGMAMAKSCAGSSKRSIPASSILEKWDSSL